jgi:hypothetical protein
VADSRTFTVKFGYESAALQRGLTKDTAALDKFEKKADSAGETASRSFAGVGRALAAVGIGVGIGQVVNAAADLESAGVQVGAVFGDAAGQVREFGDQATAALGVSEAAALNAATSFGRLFVGLGYGQEQAAKVSTQLTEVATGFAKISGQEPDQVIEAVSAAFRGEYDSLQRVIPTLNAAAIEQQAMTDTGKANAKQLTAQEKAQATLNIILGEGAKHADEIAAANDTAAVRFQAFKASVENTEAAIGSALLPVMESLASVLTVVANGVAALPQPVIAAGLGLATMAVAVRFLGPGLASLAAQASTAAAAETTLAASTAAAGTAAKGATAPTAGLAAAQAGLGGGAGGVGRIGKLGKAVKGASTGMKLLKVAASGATGALGGPWGIALGIGAGLLTEFAFNTNKATEATDDFTDALLAQGGPLTQSGQQMVAQKVVTENLDKAFAKYGITAKTVQAAASGNADAMLEIESATEKARAGTVAFVNASTGSVSFVQDASAKAVQAEYDKLAAMNASARGVEATTDRIGTALGAQAGEYDRLGTAIGKTRDEIDLFNQAEQEQASRLLGSQSALVDLHNAARELGKAVHDNKKHWEDGTAAADANKQAVIDYATKANSSLTSFKELGQTQATLDKKTASARQTLEKQLVAMGLVPAKAHELAQSYIPIPRSITTKVTLESKEAMADADDVIRKYNEIPATKNTYVNLHWSGLSPSLAKALNIKATAAMGGPISAGVPTVVGEKGPEVVVPSAGGYVLNTERLRQVFGQGGGTTNVYPIVRVYIDGREVQAQVATEVARQNAQTAASLARGRRTR